MKYFVVILFATMPLFNPAFAQETANPSLIVYNEEVPYYDLALIEILLMYLL